MITKIIEQILDPRYRLELGHSINVNQSFSIFRIPVNNWVYILAGVVLLFAFLIKLFVEMNFKVFDRIGLKQYAACFIAGLRDALWFMLGCWALLALNSIVNIVMFSRSLLNVFTIPLLLSAPVLVGVMTLSLIDRRRQYSFTEGIGLSWGIGTGLLFLLMAFFSQLKIVFFPLLIWFGYILIGLVLAGLVFLFRHKPIFGKFPKMHKTTTLILGLIVLLSFYGAAFNHEIFSDEGFYFYFAKNIKETGLINFQTLNTGTHPLLIPAMIAVNMQALIGSLGVGLCKLFFPATYSALILLFYGNLRKHASELGSLFFTFLLAGFPLLLYHSKFMYCDMPMAYFNFAGVMYSFWYLKEKQWSSLIIAVFFFGLGIHTKVSGLPLAQITFAMLALFLIGEKLRKLIYARN